MIAESKGIITPELDEWMMPDTVIEFMWKFLSSCLLLSKLSRPFLPLHMCNKLIHIYLNSAEFVYQSNNNGNSDLYSVWHTGYRGSERDLRQSDKNQGKIAEVHKTQSLNPEALVAHIRTRKRHLFACNEINQPT